MAEGRAAGSLIVKLGVLWETHERYGNMKDSDFLYNLVASHTGIIQKAEVTKAEHHSYDSLFYLTDWCWSKKKEIPGTWGWGGEQVIAHNASS